MCTVEGCDRRPVARGWCRRHYNQQWKKGLPPLDVDPADRPPHTCDTHEPSRVCYSRCACRCHACTTLTSRYERQRIKEAAYGRPRMVDATDTADRIRHLRKAGIGLRRIAEDTGLNRGNLQRLAAGRSTRVSARVATVIERYTPDHGRYIPIDRDLADHLAALKNRHTWDELADITGLSNSALWNLHHQRTATTPETRSQIMSVDVGCVDCGQPSMAGGLRCHSCFQTVATPRRPTGCGTEAGYTAHRRRSETPCTRCREAHSAAQQQRKAS